MIIVGSGASGGMSAYHLTKSGLKVLMLEAGRNYDPATETPMFNILAQPPPAKGQYAEQAFGLQPGHSGRRLRGFERNVRRRRWLQTFHMVAAPYAGARTNHWVRIALRFVALDFMAPSRDGLDYDWLISFDDLAPLYDRSERMIGITGDTTPRRPLSFIFYAASFNDNFGRTHAHAPVARR